MPLTHVRRDDEEDRGEHRHRHVAGQTARRRAAWRAASARGSCRPRASAHPIARWSPCGRWRPSPADRRTSARRCWRRPEPTSSTFGLCRSPLMRSATTADISDSMAPSMRDRERRRQQREDQRRLETPGCGTPAGPRARRRSATPTVSTGSWATQATRRAGDEADDGAGNSLHEPVRGEHEHERRHGQAERRPA